LKELANTNGWRDLTAASIIVRDLSGAGGSTTYKVTRGALAVSLRMSAENDSGRISQKSACYLIDPVKILYS